MPQASIAELKGYRFVRPDVSAGIPCRTINARTALLQSDPASFSSNPALVAKNGTPLPEGDIETISVDGKVVVYTDGKLFSGETAEEIPGFRAAGVGDVRIVDGIIVARNDDTNVTRILLPAS